MNVSTLIIGFAPTDDFSGLKPSQIRNNKYFEDLLADFDLGEVCFANHDNFKEVLDKVNPFVVVVFDESRAYEVKNHKKDVWIYVTDHPSSIFYRKAEVEQKQKEQGEIFKEISGLVQQIREDGEENQEKLRRVASMSYEDIYDMLIKMIISEKPDLQKMAWRLLSNNNGNKQFIWMRAQLLTEVWQGSDGKKREEFLCLAMNQHIQNGIARKMEDFTDADGQQYHQYMFKFFDGNDANYIRRIPVGHNGQDKYAYEAILDKYETPNGLRVMLEAGHAEGEKKEIFNWIE